MTSTAGATAVFTDRRGVTPDHRSPFEFSRRLEKVLIDVSGDLILDPEAELRMGRP